MDLQTAAARPNRNHHLDEYLDETLLKYRILSGVVAHFTFEPSHQDETGRPARGMRAENARFDGRSAESEGQLGSSWISFLTNWLSTRCAVTMSWVVDARP